MKIVWKLQDAKSQFSKVVEEALKDVPQYVTKRGHEAVVVLSAKKYKELISDKLSFNQFLLNCPKMDDNFSAERQKDFSRSIDL